MYSRARHGEPSPIVTTNSYFFYIVAVSLLTLDHVVLIMVRAVVVADLRILAGLFTRATWSSNTDQSMITAKPHAIRNNKAPRS